MLANLERKIDISEYKYFEDEELPVLVLASKEKYDFYKRRVWKKIAHQTAGYLCHQHYLIGTVLNPKPDVAKKIKDISDYWLDSNDLFSVPSLDTIITYRKQLRRKLGVDCNGCYSDFEEGIYPIDCTPENVRKLCSDNLLKDFDSYVKWKKHEKFMGCMNRWKLYILGENSD